MTRPKSELGRLDIVSDDLAASWRTLRLLRMLAAIGTQTGVVDVLKGMEMRGMGGQLLHFRGGEREPIMANRMAQQHHQQQQMRMALAQQQQQAMHRGYGAFRFLVGLGPCSHECIVMHALLRDFPVHGYPSSL